MKNIYLFIIAFSAPFLLWSQGNFPSENGLFEVDYLKGCVGTTITVTPIAATGTYLACFDADLTDLTSSENQTCFNEQANKPVGKLEFTYTEPGIYNILVLNQLTGSQQFDSLTIKIFDPELPQLALSNCNGDIFFNLNPEVESFDIYNINFGDGTPPQNVSINNFPISHTYSDNTLPYTVQATGSFDASGFNNCSNTTYTNTIVPENLNETAATITSLDLISASTLEIAFNANENQFYSVEISQNNNTPYNSVRSLSRQSVGTLQLDNLDLTNNFYCVRIVSKSLCTGNDLLSNEVCSIQLTGDAQADGNLLEWNSGSFTTSTLYKNGIEIYTGNSPFLDTNVLCGQTDNYEIIATNASGIEVRSLAVEIIAEASASQLPITQVSTRVLSSGELEIEWEVPQGLQPETYIVYKKQKESDNFREIATTDSTSFTDTSSDFTSGISFYSVSYSNNCSGRSPLVATAPNILLTANESENIINFSWNSFTGYDSLLSHYLIRKYDRDLNLVDEWDIGHETFFSDDVANAGEQIYIYQVFAISENGLISSSNQVQFKIPPSFFVPSGFTPNGDALNEEIKVVGKFIEQVEFSIFNRWGTLIFRSNELDKGWDGFLPDREAPEGTYSYTIVVKDAAGEEYFKSGVFNLIR
ncbi:gliding motility-associated C-terminal domain-containing protein [Marivirga lumbricoides]|uniref:T9SS type B sorting domain-containing protein n=1 Tax=Marivirga lumbricoides TaxID=1046115 RepID=UPI001662F888